MGWSIEAVRTEVRAFLKHSESGISEFIGGTIMVELAP